MRRPRAYRGWESWDARVIWLEAQLDLLTAAAMVKKLKAQ